MKVTLTDGKVFQILGVHGKTMNYQGVTRDSLIFLFDPDKVSLDSVLEAFTEKACSSIAITDDDGNTFFHEDYTIRIEAGTGYKEMIMTGGVASTDTDQTVYVRMAQTTLTERTIQQQQDTIDALVVAVLEG